MTSPANSDEEVLTDEQAVAELKRILWDTYAWEKQLKSDRAATSFSLEEVLDNEAWLEGQWDME